MAYVEGGARLYWRQVRGGTSSDSDNGETEFNHMTDYTVRWRKDTADSASNGATTNSPIMRIPYKSKVVSAHWLQEAATSAVATAYATMTLRKNNGSNSTMLSVGAFSTQTTALAAYTSRAMTLTASNCTITSGSCLYLGIAKTGAGRKIAEGVLTVVLRRL